MGNIMTDLQSRRAIILGIESLENYQILRSVIPEAEMYNYSTDLRSLTQGKATFQSRFHAYEPVPEHIQQELVREKEAV